MKVPGVWEVRMGGRGYGYGGCMSVYIWNLEIGPRSPAFLASVFTHCLSYFSVAVINHHDQVKERVSLELKIPEG